MYSFFDAQKNKKFDDGNGNEVSLGEHLHYLNKFGGTPESFDRTDSDNRQHALNLAQNTGHHLFVVDESTWRVVGEVNKS